jgi:hypothetical protein
VLISQNLRSILRTEGYAKLAAQVMRNENEYVDDIETIEGAATSLAMKVAANRANRQTIYNGLASYRRAQEL